MNNIELLFEENSEIQYNKMQIKGHTLLVNIFPKDGLFTGREIKNILHAINYIHSKYGKTKFTIQFRFGEVSYIDKLTYVFLECICYYLIAICKHPVQVFFKPKTDIRTIGINSSPLLLLNGTKLSSIKKFPRQFEFDIYGCHFRKLIRYSEAVSNYLGDLYEQIDRFLKLFGIDNECRDQVGLVITELVGNACEHALSDCLVDIDVAPDFKKCDSKLCVEEKTYYYGINIAIINFSQKLLGDDIKKNIVKAKNVPSGRYLDVTSAYTYHKEKFGDAYNEDDFCNITTFQSKISGRKEKFATGGTGLPVLIKSLEDRSNTYRCYVISGDRCVNFYHDILEYDDNGWIGFNNDNNYATNIPRHNVTDGCFIYMPGTAYNFNFVMKGEKNLIMNEIYLQFDKSTTRLAGNPYGRSIFKSQAANKIDYSSYNVIIFPDQIEKVASSFTQGFFAEIIERIGYSDFDKVVSIKAKTRELEKSIQNDLFV